MTNHFATSQLILPTLRRTPACVEDHLKLLRWIPAGEGETSPQPDSGEEVWLQLTILLLFLATLVHHLQRMGSGLKHLGWREPCCETFILESWILPDPSVPGPEQLVIVASNASADPWIPQSQHGGCQSTRWLASPWDGSPAEPVEKKNRSVLVIQRE